MSQPRCPGQDQRYWKPEDIYNVTCPLCAAQIEFWKDEPIRRCRACKRDVRNPKLDAGCANWCQHSDDCLGRLPEEPPAWEPEGHGALGVDIKNSIRPNPNGTT